MLSSESQRLLASPLLGHTQAWLGKTMFSVGSGEQIPFGERKEVMFAIWM